MPPQTATGAQQTAFVVIRLSAMLVFCFALLELLANVLGELELVNAIGQPARMFVEIPLAILRFLILGLSGGVCWLLCPLLSRRIAVKLDL